MVTKQQFASYRRVQDSGMYNMLTPNAVIASGLDKDTYFDIVKTYDTYYEKFEGGRDE